MTEPTIAGFVSQNFPSFIEAQFPVAKVSMESYKERMANNSQTLTGLGKWWGRKPLVLVRSILLGLLLPASNYSEKDREIFLKIMTMDSEGLHLRKYKPIPDIELINELRKMPPSIKKRFLVSEKEDSVLLKLTREEKTELQNLVYNKLAYSKKLKYCTRPEQINGPSENIWVEINDYLGTHAHTLPELIQELGKLRFGHIPIVGDAFCGGGSIPFESARLGCSAYGSDLNPIATLLTWASINILGGVQEFKDALCQSQMELYDAIDKQILEWGIEINSLGWRADGYLYCTEVIDPETSWKVPLAPSWVIGQGTKTIAKLIPDEELRRYEIEIIQGVSDNEIDAAISSGTLRDSYLVPPLGGQWTSIETIRRDIRMWENDDLIPRSDDVFQERLYCIQWAEIIQDENGRKSKKWHYRAPTNEDLKREEKVLELLKSRFQAWQEKGYIPRRKIEPGYNTDQPIRERGWTYWHHLFTPRQLLLCGLVMEYIDEKKLNPQNAVMALLGLGRCLNYMSRLSTWHPAKGNENVERVFTNQALNTLSSYASRSWPTLRKNFLFDIPSDIHCQESTVLPLDARQCQSICDLWITDPPYADAVNYEEITEFFLSWYDAQLLKSFPTWYSDSKRALAVKGVDLDFRKSMVDCYKQLAKNMPENGMQVVMFTHQDAAVWADLTMILWAAGLRVTAAWTIATETDSVLRQGNYVQGTVLLVLRKRIASESLFLDEISHKVEDEVRHQLDEMNRMEDDSDPNFGDADYQLAAYAAALRVLTSQPIEEIDPEKEIQRERKPGEVGQVEALIRRAVKIACDHLIPKGLDADLWKTLGSMERFYIKGLEVESHGEYRSGVYQELARGFGATSYTDLLESTKANETRLKSAIEFGKKMLGTFGLAGESFSDSLVRQCLFAVWLTVKNEGTREGLDYLHTELREAYWSNREKITGILEYLAALRHSGSMENWQKDAHGATLLAGAVRNDHV